LFAILLVVKIKKVLRLRLQIYNFFAEYVHRRAIYFKKTFFTCFLQ